MKVSKYKTLGFLAVMLIPSLSSAAALEDAVVDHMSQVHKQDQKSGGIAHREATKTGPAHAAATVAAMNNGSSANRVEASKKQQIKRRALAKPKKK